ncbi:uncharacterized protein LOC133793707 [Humulus lupulus]|uniref:uncharacterized protein LOC133793707 n=1 Tax=Humulus lupulus TaxID=3486 RepID=UPI002B4135F7|nr:uncharacterized protein LOC133793707 [Humulus lupulus]
MSILAWNCHGLGNQWTLQFLKDLTIQKKPDFIFLSETLSKKDRLERVRTALGFEGLFVVEVQGHSGGLALLWRHEEEARLLSYSTSHIDVQISIAGKAEWRFTGLYGEPSRGHRRQTWDLLRTLASASSLPWCIMGDVNNVVGQEDKRGGNPYPGWLINGFNQPLTDCGLIDLDLTGYPYTWERGRGSSEWIEVRLDRALVSQSWFNLFLYAKLFNLDFSTSNHCPILLEFNFAPVTHSLKKFKFENAWLREPMCTQIIRDSWEVCREGNIQEKIRYCGMALMDWGKDYTGNFAGRIKG